MTSRIALLFSVALILTFASLIKSDSTAAQVQSQTYVADTGLIALNTGQTLRLTAVNTGSEPVTVRFKKTEYADAGSTGMIVRKQPAQTISEAITLSPGQAAGIDFQYTIKDIRGEADVSKQTVKLNAFVITPQPTSSTGGGANGSDLLAHLQISFN